MFVLFLSSFLSFRKHKKKARFAPSFCVWVYQIKNLQQRPEKLPIADTFLYHAKSDKIMFFSVQNIILSTKRSVLIILSRKISRRLFSSNRISSDYKRKLNCRARWRGILHQSALMLLYCEILSQADGFHHISRRAHVSDKHGRGQ